MDARRTGVARNTDDLSMRCLLMLFLCLIVAACGPFRARPDLKSSTLTQPESTCVRGYRTQQTSTVGMYGTPLVNVTDIPCSDQP